MLGVEILSVRKEPILGGFLILNAQNITSEFLYFHKCSKHLEWETTQHRFSDGENFLLGPHGVLMAHTEWLPGVQLRCSVPPVQYI